MCLSKNQDNLNRMIVNLLISSFYTCDNTPSPMHALETLIGGGVLHQGGRYQQLESILGARLNFLL
jgi:hypothetical protein